MSVNNPVQNTKEYIAGIHQFINVGTGSTSVAIPDIVSQSDINVMTIQNGNVGIGTTNPTQALYVVGNILATGTVTASNISVIGDFVTLNTITSNTEQMVITNAGTGPALKVTQTGANSIAEFYDDGGVLALKVADGGNVGIGTTAPLQSLHVQSKAMFVGQNTSNQVYRFTNSIPSPPSVDGFINGVSITALNKRTRTSYAAAKDCVSTWTTRASAANNVWNSVCWAPELSLFCAVAFTGIGNRVMTSPDGITWTSQASAADNNWTSVCWSPELSLFCAVASGNGTGDRVMTSPNGITWTIQVSAADNLWRSVCWAPELSLFCAVSYDGTGDRVMTSPDGITWTTRASAADNNWTSVCWSPELSLFCAVAESGTGDRVMTSPDGITWTTQTSAGNYTWLSVCWAAELSLFCAVAYSGAERVMTSPDGITWTVRTVSEDEWTSVCWAPELSLFCAVSQSYITGNRVMTSPDGITWTTRTAPVNGWISVCWAPELSLFCSVCWGPNYGNRVMTSAIGMPNAKSVVKALPSQMMVNARGNVGIGTTNPPASLSVWGTGQASITSFDTNTMGGTLQICDLNSSPLNGGALVFGTSQGNFTAIKSLITNGNNNSTGHLGFFTRNANTDTTLTNRMIITDTGSVGIGTTNPTQKLHVQGNMNTTGYLTQAGIPAFFAYGTNGAFTSTTGKITFTLTQVNNGNTFNTTNGRFTAPVTGIYKLAFAAILRYGSAVGVGELTFWKNGGNLSPRAYGYSYVTGAGDHDWTYVSIICSLTIGDFIEPYVHALTAGTTFYYGEGLGYFMGHLLG